MFEAIRNQADDPIESVYARSGRDMRPDKLDLSIGVYRDAKGQVTVMRAVRDAEDRILRQHRPKGYLTPLGNMEYVAAVEELVFGATHPVLRARRLVSAQGPGAGGMLRFGAELIRTLAPQATLWVSEPVWDHQIDFFTRAGMKVRSYPYYDRVGQGLRFADMCAAFERLPARDVVLLHGCCHNPTGEDPTAEQWRSLADILAARDVLPFLDVAYQGFGDDIETDVEGLRIVAERVPEMLLAVSSSKSFGVYRDRAGMLSLLVDSGSDRDSVGRYLRDLSRGLYFMAPDHGAAIVSEILRDPALRRLWREELDAYRARIIASRERLANAMLDEMPDRDWSYLRRQKGMFSCLPLGGAQLEALMRDHAIYLLNNGRLNFAALPEQHAARVSAAVRSVMGIGRAGLVSPRIARAAPT